MNPGVAAVKFHWFVATAAYAAACAAAAGLGPDRILLRRFVSGGDLLDALRLLWMIPILAATAAVWASARRGIRPAHAELSAALALGALAFPFVSFPEPAGLPRFIQSSAAAFVLVFAAVLGNRAFALRHPEPVRQSSLS